jgi:hypothetical protein
MLDTLSHNVFAFGNGYNYRHTVAIGFRDETLSRTTPS